LLGDDLELVLFQKAKDGRLPRAKAKRSKIGVPGGRSNQPRQDTVAGHDAVVVPLIHSLQTNTSFLWRPPCLT